MHEWITTAGSLSAVALLLMTLIPGIYRRRRFWIGSRIAKEWSWVIYRWRERGYFRENGLKVPILYSNLLRWVNSEGNVSEAKSLYLSFLDYWRSRE